MITRIDLDISPMRSGESRDLTIWADRPLSVGIKCFVATPPPPGFRECETCGDFSAQSGVPVKVLASPNLFRRSRGEMRIHVSDDSGDFRDLHIDVIS